MDGSYTVFWHTLDTLPLDGPGIYNRAPNPECRHDPSRVFPVCLSAEANAQTPHGVPTPDAVVCLDCGCDALRRSAGHKGKKGSATCARKTREECESLIREEFLCQLDEGHMGPATVNRVLIYLFGWKRAFPEPRGFYRGRALPDRRLAKMRSMPWRSPTALSTMREARALGAVEAFSGPLCAQQRRAMAFVRSGSQFQNRKYPATGSFLPKHEADRKWIGLRTA